MHKLAVFLVGTPLALGGAASAQQPIYFGPVTCCPQGTTGPCCIGQWSGPYDLGISCPGPFQQPVGPPPAGFNCDGLGGPTGGSFEYWDEIAHAVLLPWGAFWPEDPNDPAGPQVNVGGKVLVWTAWDDSMARGNNPYTTYVFDPNTLGSSSSVILEAPILVGSGGGPLPDDSGIFCSGHTWTLDENQKPELLVVGGARHDPMMATTKGPLALNKAYAFDPNAATAANAWSDDPADLPVPNWYPTVITYGVGNPVTSFLPIVLGGSGIRPDKNGCGVFTENSVEYAFQYDRWWTLPTSAGPWTVQGAPDTYYWQQYPRSLFLSDRTVLSVGSAIICEAGLPPAVSTEVSTQAFAQYPIGTEGEFGGNPINAVDVASMTRTQPIASPAGVGGWEYANVVLMHTLKNRSLYQTNLSNYDLDRVIVHGGAQDGFEDHDPPSGSTDGLMKVREWEHDHLNNKTAAPQSRLFGNFVVLPDGSILAMGGREFANQPVYVNEVARFWPETPTSWGTWEEMQSRPIVGTSTFYGEYATPRGYHSVGLLLQDGRVALMGGRHETDSEFSAANSIHSVEIFAPPYTFESNRLKILGGIATLKYGTEVGFNVNHPERVVYACLIGLGSVTHHFDYNGRYVELMTSTTSVPNGKDVKVWVPDAELLPEGPYLLFVVEERPGLAIPLVRVPSMLGRFVTVTF